MKGLGIYYFIAVSWVLFAAGCQESSSAGKKENDPPNFILIYMDDLGYGDVSAYGATEIHTPHMDQLAQGGRRFTRGYATSDRKSTRLNSSHVAISYAVFCLKSKTRAKYGI